MPGEDVLETVHGSGTYAIIQNGEDALLQFVTPTANDQTVGYHVRVIEAPDIDV